MTIRFAILAGVSTEPQAREDKMSIPDQVANCRTFIAANGGEETAGPFIMDGYSRSGYDSLDVAMSEIPPLGEAILQASKNKYDILIMDHFDRMGDLSYMINTRFKKLRKQLHSVRQSGKVTTPEAYDPYSSESADIQMHVDGIVQVYRINKLRRAWNTGVPDRALLGLHPLTIPFGYRVASIKNEPAVPVPAEIKLLRQLKDLFLDGMTLQHLCKFADASGVKPRKGAPNWSRTVIRRMLLNRYYAGVTTFGRFRKVNKQRIPVPRSQWKIGVGRHEPVWDQKTYERILAEFERREGLRSRGQVYALSGLLRCTRCGNRLYRHGKVDGRFPVYISCNNVSDCLSVRYDEALQWVAEQVVRELKNYKKLPLDPKPDTTQQELDELRQLRQRVQQGFEAGLYTEAEAGARIVSIETDMEHILSRAEREAQRHEHQQALLQFAEQDLEKLHDWILHDDPTTVNRLLTALCEEIQISPLRELTVVFR